MLAISFEISFFLSSEGRVLFFSTIEGNENEALHNNTGRWAPWYVLGSISLLVIPVRFAIANAIKWVVYGIVPLFLSAEIEKEDFCDKMWFG